LIRITAANTIVKWNKLTTDGIYQYFAHPLYLGSMIIAFGLFVISRVWLLGLLLVILQICFHVYFIKLEDELLWLKFGNKYNNYLNSVPSKLSGIVKSFASIRFSKIGVLRELKTIILIIVGILLMIFKEIF